MKTCRIPSRIGLVALGAIAIGGNAALAQEHVDFDAPVSVVFLVTDVGASTPDGSVTTLSFSNASLTAGKKLRISVQADVSDFYISTGGTAIAASRVSWTTSNASSGTGWGGTLSSGGYATVFESNADPTAGSVDISWQLSAPGSGTRAGDHTLTLRWKLESVGP
jgi:hypothetical protein